MKARITLAIAAVLGIATAHAAGLQVAPTRVTLAGRQAALWLTDTGSAPTHAQVRVYRWQQVNGKDVLTPAGDVVASPPMALVQPGAKQLIRIIYTGAPVTKEQAYRVAVDELPIATPDSPGLRFLIHYSVPAFVEPPGAKPAPALAWSDSGGALEVTNTGTDAAQVAMVCVNGKLVAKGAMRWVLAGSATTWRELRVVGNSTITAQVNGYPHTYTIAGGSADAGAGVAGGAGK